MNPPAFVRGNWRLLVLVVLLVAAAYFLFVPGAPITGPAADAGANASDGPTNIQFGIDLAGGARITAPVHGYHAEDVGVDDSNADQIVVEVADAMNVSEADVVTSQHVDAQTAAEEDFVEVRERGDRAEFLAGLQAAGLDVDDGDVQTGVRDQTRSEIVEVLDRRLGESGFGGGSVTQLRDRDPPQVRVEAPGQDPDDLEALVSERGEVAAYAHVPPQSPAVNGSEPERIRLFGQDGIQGEPSPARTAEDGTAYVSVTLTQEAADQFTDVMQETEFASQGYERCGPEEEPAPDDWCLLTVVDGDIVFSGSLDDGLAEDFQTGAFRDSRQFRLTTGDDLSQAQDLRINVIAGELPAPMNTEDASESFVSPGLADDFRQNSLIVGIAAVIAVVLTVFLRYGDPKVAAPMSATALSEVVILLGFAAAIGWPLELSHVAGFVAVIGTGVDDLIIIADEIKQQGQVTSQRVFQNRFRKAFWVIGAAAATTIVAMSPLAILNLGDLRGFAIITILGVLIGIAVTRPAYGSILRRLTTGEH